MQTIATTDWSGRFKSPPGILLMACIGAIVFLSLYPWVGWRNPATQPWQFLNEPWPRYWTGFDVVVNTLAYWPLGILLAFMVARPVHQSSGARSMFMVILVASCIGSALSLGLECLQSWLPTRIPARLDWICNSIGAFTGAVTGTIIIGWLQRGFVHDRRFESWSRLTPGRFSIGVLALMLWMVIQTHPQRLLFASGDISGIVADWFDLELPALTLTQIAWIEPFIVAAQMCIIGSLVWTAISHPLGRRLALILVIGGGLLIKSIVYSQLATGAESLWWLTAGAQGGLVIGATGLALLTTLKPVTQNRFAFVLLVVVTIAGNVAPDNPFFDTMIDNWDTGRLSSLHALIETISVIWPILVMTYFWLARLAYNRLHEQ